jgi:hypothetical protein
VSGDANGTTTLPTAAERIAAVEKRRNARRLQSEDVRLEQVATDLEAFESLETEHGEGKVKRLDLPYFTSGLPTFVVVRAPDEQYVKRMRTMIRATPKNPGPAQDMLADVCVAYPDAPTYKRVRAEYGAIHDSVGNAAVKLSQAQAAEEGKD